MSEDQKMRYEALWNKHQEVLTLLEKVEGDLARAIVVNEGWQRDFTALAVKKGVAEAHRDRLQQLVDTYHSEALDWAT